MTGPRAYPFVLGGDRWVASLVVALAYLLGAFAGHALSWPNAFATLWPPNGILVAALFVSPRWLWPYLVLASCPANLIFNHVLGQPLLVSLAYWMVNVGEATLIAHLLLRFADPRHEPQRSRTFGAFVLVTASTTLAGGVLGALATRIALPEAAFVQLWLAWWMADLLSVVVTAPVLIAIADGWLTGRAVTRECRAFAVVLGAVSALELGMILSGSGRGDLVQPLLIPLLGWAALRLGVPGTSWAVLVTTVLTLLNVAHGGDGLLPGDLTPTRALALQAVLCGLSITFLGVAAAIADARDVEHDTRRRDAVRSDFVATVMAEIRAPLDAILASVRAIERDAGSDAARTRPLHAIERAARQILDVAEDLRAAERTAHLAGEVLAETLWLPKLWKDLGDDCARLPRPAAVALRWTAPAPDVTLSTDRWRLEVVVQNLVMSALEATTSGEVAVSCRAGDGRLTIAVRDTGPGIPVADQERILTAYRHDLAERGVRQGPGVGLFTVLRFVGELGGEVAVDSEVGCGSEFRVTLPLASPPARARRTVA